MSEPGVAKDSGKGQVAGLGLTIVSSLAPALKIPLPLWLVWTGIAIGVVMMCWPLIAGVIQRIRRSKVDASSFVIFGLSVVVIGALITIGALVFQKKQKPENAQVAPSSNVAANGKSDLIIPKLGTQIAKEDFQKALNDMLQIVRRAENLVKTSEELGGNQPLIRMDNDDGGDLIARLLQLDTEWKIVYTAFMDGAGGQFFAQFPPTQKNSLASILPNGSQQIWEKYHQGLIKFTVAAMLVRDAHPKRVENGAQFQRAITNVEFATNDFRAASSPIHQWVQSVTQRADELSNNI